MEGAYDFKVTEPAILAFWEKKKVYEKAKSGNKGKKRFYFLDGPPYTSGRIHLGQAWNKVLKDCVLRYKRMSGFDVYDRAGYDMHGLPTAHKVEEKFGLRDKEDIIKFGIDKFVNECKKFSTENMNLMTKDFLRLGVWMDFENAYQPIQNSFIEGEWWLVKKAHENNRLYEGKRTMTWCPHCATALAKHELDYKTITDNSIFVKFPVAGKDREFLIVWTTTPWTLAFNMAIMVNPELDYVKADVEGETWIVAKALAPSLISAVANKKFKVVEEFKGKDLKGLKYEHPWKSEIRFFSELKNDKLHTVVLSAEYVDTSAGSGLVHCAPGCGPEDYEVGYREDLPPFNSIDEYGRFPESMGKFAGIIARKDDEKFTGALGSSLIATTEVEHEYAHCWRCHNPVIFRTTKQWFFNVEDLKERMRALNKKVLWQPDWAGSRQFDSWLDNLRDNSITKQRFWGTPLPVWKCDKCSDYVVIGSSAELKKLAGRLPKDLHKPWIDEITIKCKCGGIKKRIPDILDVWIDAGTTSWTCLDYPQKKDLFKKLFPPDFILEGKDQIRGWFNLLFVASMVSMNQPSYKAVYMHGFVQDALGRKMSKSLGNVISPYEVIDRYGSDTLRFYMTSGANPGIDINYNFEDMKVKNRNLVVLWNLHKFLIDYYKNLKISLANLDKEITKKLFSIEERYIFSVLNSAIKKVTSLFEEYRLNEVPLVVEELFLELSRTYIQLVREKSSTGSDEERKVVFYTIYTVLLESLKLFAPVCPFITEQMYQNLREVFKLKPESIHLYDWPSHDSKAIDRNLENNMRRVSAIVQSALSAREKAHLGVRWPLKELIVVTSDENTVKAVQALEDIIKLQTNVKEVKLQDSLSVIKTKIKADYSQIGQDFGDLAPKIIARISMESPETILSHIDKEGKCPVSLEGKKVNIVKEHLIVQREVPYPFEESAFSNGFVYINKERTKELEAEGFAREVMRRVQSLRKKAGLVKSDRITLFIKVDEDLKEFLDEWEKQIKEKVGASTMRISELNPSKKHKFSSKEKVKGKGFEIFFDIIEKYLKKD